MGSGKGGKYYIRGGNASVVVDSRLDGPRTSVRRGSHKAESLNNPNPKGLINVGNTCYANAALQCLLSTALSHALLDPKASALFRRYSSNPNLLDEEKDNDTSMRRLLSSSELRERERDDRRLQENCQWLTRELKALTLEYHAQKPAPPPSISEWFSPPRRPAVNPGSITRHPDRLSQCLRPYQQEDAHEFLRALLATLVMNGHNKQLSSLFDGLLESSVTCQTCQYPSLTRDRYMDLSLDIVGENVGSLNDALDEFTKMETLSGDNKFHCEKCDTKRIANKELRLATAPSVLVCHFKRFAFDNYGNVVRLHKYVSFPQRLDISNCMSRVNRARPPPYDLVAVLVHQGKTCDSGHYLAYVKTAGKWYKCNDSQIDEVDVETVLKQQAYILMYEVAEMREKHGFPCPNRSHAPWSDEAKGKAIPEHVSAWAVLLSAFGDTSLLGDFCCYDHNGQRQNSPARVRVAMEEQSPERTVHSNADRSDETSHLCDSTVSSSDTARPRLHRSTSSGSINTLDKNTFRRPRAHSTSGGRRRRRQNSFTANSDPGIADKIHAYQSRTRGCSASRERTSSRSNLRGGISPRPGLEDWNPGRSCRVQKGDRRPRSRELPPRPEYCKVASQPDLM